jgi:MFS family permease
VLSSLTGAAGAAWQVGVLRAGAWVARGLRSPSRNALLADTVTPAVYGRAYGFERAMDNLGAVIGPLLALALLAAIGVRAAILVSVVPGLLAVVAIVYAVRHTAAPRAQEHRPLRIRVRPVLHGALGRLMFAVGAFEAGNIAATLLILRATDLLEPGRGHQHAVELALLLYTLYNVAATLVSLPAGRAADRRGAVIVLLGGVACALAAYVGFALAGASVAVLAACFLGAGVAIGCVETAEHAAVAALAPVELRGSAFGLLAAVQSFGNLVASAVAGVLWTVVSPAAGLLFAGAMMAVALAGLLVASIKRATFN